MHDHDLYALLADNAAQRRDAEAIEQFAPTLEALAARDGHTLYQAIADRALGVAGRLTGDYAASRARLNRAFQVFAARGARWQLGRTYFELGELALAEGDTPTARVQFSRALSEFVALKAAPAVQRAEQALASIGSTPLP